MNQHTVVEQVFKQRGEPAYNFTPKSIFPGGAQNYNAPRRERYRTGRRSEPSEADFFCRSWLGENERFAV